MEKVLTREDYKLIRSLLGATQKSLVSALGEYVKQNYPKYKITDDYVYGVGNIPVALVAHLDTVLPSPPRDIFYDREQGVIWGVGGLGADDRAGVFSILKILQTGLRPSVIFTTEEEVGGIGAMKLVETYIKPLSKINYIVELDRQGYDDCVFYDCDNPEFEKWIEGFGFKTQRGSFSDICDICPKWGVAGVNLSVGYFNEHSYAELLHVPTMFETIEKVKTLLNTKSKFFEYIEKKYDYSEAYSIANTELIKIEDCEEYCYKCGRQFHESELILVIGLNGELKYACADCCGSDIDWCRACGFAYETSPEINTCKCPDCREEDWDCSTLPKIVL